MKKDTKNSNINTKATIISVIVAVWIICIALIFTKCEMDKRAAQPQTPDIQNEEVSEVALELQQTKTTKTGSVETQKSKTTAFFDKRYKNTNFTAVVEYMISSKEQGEFYQTEFITSSTDGYKYKEVYMDSYNTVQEYEGDIPYMAYLYTPQKGYLLNPDTMTYTEHETNSSAESDTYNFETKTLETGKITFRNAEYDYELYKEATGTETTYLFDESGDIQYIITKAPNGEVITKYISYSTDIDASLFEIPDGYTPM